MSHFSRKNLRFLAPQFGPINILSSKQRNRVLTFLLKHHALFELKGFKSIAIGYMCPTGDPILRDRRWLVLLFRFDRAREGDM